MNSGNGFAQHNQPNGQQHQQGAQQPINQNSAQHSHTEQELLSQYTEITQINQELNDKKIRFSAQRSHVQERLNELLEIAKNQYGVTSSKELLALYQSNLEHNQRVIPQAYQQAVQIRELANQIESKLNGQ